MRFWPGLVLHWLVTLLVGSVTAALALFLTINLLQGTFHWDGIFYVLGILLLVSALSSLPIELFLVNKLLRYKSQRAGQGQLDFWDAFRLFYVATTVLTMVVLGVLFSLWRLQRFPEASDKLVQEFGGLTLILQAIAACYWPWGLYFFGRFKSRFLDEK